MKPYKTTQELLEAAKIHGPYVMLSGGRYYLISSIYELGENTWSCVLSGPKRSLKPQEFLAECTWQDGSPCGKNENYDTININNKCT